MSFSWIFSYLIIQRKPFPCKIIFLFMYDEMQRLYCQLVICSWMNHLTSTVFLLKMSTLDCLVSRILWLEALWFYPKVLPTCKSADHKPCCRQPQANCDSRKSRLICNPFSHSYWLSLLGLLYQLRKTGCSPSGRSELQQNVAIREQGLHWAA